MQGCASWMASRLPKPTILGFVQFVLCVYSAVSALAPSPVGMLENGDTICPRDTICSKGALELVTLSVSRVSAYWMYAPMVLVFLTKCHALRSMLHNSAISVFVPFCDEHDFHMNMGMYIAGASIIHTIFHLIRWGVQSNLHYNWSTVPGRTGWIATIAMTLVIVPMLIPWVKQRLSFEMRKGLHYFCIIAGICLAFHAPKGYIGWVMGICTSIYVADLMWRKFCMTFKCISPDFVPLGDAVQITFKAPTMNFAASGGFVLVCVPSINRWQWHPFTVFPSSAKPGHWCVLVGRAGNWTEAVYAAVEKKTVGPIWIQGCFPSSFSTAEDYDNLVLVAAGTGITNALSAIQKLEGGRRLNVIWVCRQSSLINHYVPQLATNVQGFTLIYYTGKGKKEEPLIENTFGAHVLFFRKRPDYMKAITSIIIGSETGEWIPDKQVEFADEFFRLVSPHASADFGYVEVFHLMRLVFNRNDSGDNRVNRAAVEQLYHAMTPETQHEDHRLAAFVSAFEWDEHGTVSMDKFVGGMRRFSTEDALPAGLHYSSEEDNASCEELSLEHCSPPPSLLPDSVHLGRGPVPVSTEESFRSARRKHFRPSEAADSGARPSEGGRTGSGRHGAGALTALDEHDGATRTETEGGGGAEGRGVRGVALSEALVAPGRPASASLKLPSPLAPSLPAGAADGGVNGRLCFLDTAPPALSTQPPSQSPGSKPQGVVVSVESGRRLLPLPGDSPPLKALDALGFPDTNSPGPSVAVSAEPESVEPSEAGASQRWLAESPCLAERTEGAERGRRWSVASMEGAPAGGGRRRSSVVASLQTLGRRISNAFRPDPFSLSSPVDSQPASSSYRKDRLRGWSSSANVFGSARSTVSASGSVHGRAWPPTNWGSFKGQAKRQQSFNLKRALKRSGSHQKSDRAATMSKVVDYVSALQGEEAMAMAPPEDLSRWEVLYCGGASKAVTDILTEVTAFLGVSLMTEQFNW